MSEDIINSRQSKDAYIKYLDAQFEKHGYLRLTLKTGKQRTSAQNASLHLFCQMLAEALNDAGFDMKKTLKPEIDIPWTMESVKQNLWKPVQLTVIDKKSTTEALTAEYGKVYEVLMRHLSERLGIFVSWPCKEDMK